MKLSLTKNLDPIREKALRQIDNDAQKALERFRTSGEYAAVAYAHKRAECELYKVGSQNTPMLKAEANALGLTESEVVIIWSDKMSEEQQAMAQIEAVRLCAKKSIRECATPAAINNAVLDVIWP